MFSTGQWLGAIAFAVSPFVLASVAASVACSTTTVTTIVDEGGLEEVEGGKPAGREGGGASTPAKGCEGYCKKVESLKCKNQSTCQEDCEKLIETSPSKCKDEANAMIDCLATSATFDGCSTTSGNPKAKGCEDETMEYLQCLPKDGGKEAGPGGGGTDCKSIGTGKPTCDMCLDANCCAQESACYDNAECQEFNKCLIAGKTPATCKAEHPTGSDDAQSFNACVTSKCLDKCQ